MLTFYDTTHLSSRGSCGGGEPEGEPREVEAGADDAVVVVRIHAHQVLVLQVQNESLRKGNKITKKKYLVVKAVDAKVALLEFILVEVRPSPDLGVDDMREPFSTRNLQVIV